MRNKIFFVFGMIFTILPNIIGGEITGKVIRIVDGDTIIIQSDDTTWRIRLFGIDAPEKSQSYGTIAKIYLAIAVADKPITVQTGNRDRYGRIIGVVWYAQQNINAELVQNGLAWHYRQYAPHDTALAQYENYAQKQKIGLWSEDHPIPPWDYRKRSR